MPNRFYTEHSAESIGQNVTKSMILLNPVTNDGVITELGASFDGITTQAAFRVELYRVTTLGSPAGTSFTPRKMDPRSNAAQWTALTDLTTEPTAVEALRHWYLTPQSGLIIVQFPLGREPVAAGGGARMGLRVISPTSGVTATLMTAYLEHEE